MKYIIYFGKETLSAEYNNKFHTKTTLLLVVVEFQCFEENYIYFKIYTEDLNF